MKQWDDPLWLALQRAEKPRTGRRRSDEANNAYFREYRKKNSVKMRLYGLERWHGIDKWKRVR